MSRVHVTISLEIEVVERTDQLTIEQPAEFALSAVRCAVGAFRAAIEWTRPGAPCALRVTAADAKRAS